MTIKNLNIILLAFLFVQCAGNKSGKEQATNESAATAVEQWLTFEGQSDKPNIVLVSGDEEYRSEEALPMLAKILAKKHGFPLACLILPAPTADYQEMIQILEHQIKLVLMVDQVLVMVANLTLRSQTVTHKGMS